MEQSHATYFKMLMRISIFSSVIATFMWVASAFTFKLISPALSPTQLSIAQDISSLPKLSMNLAFTPLTSQFYPDATPSLADDIAQRSALLDSRFGSVLSASDTLLNTAKVINFNVKSLFNEDANFSKDATVEGTLTAPNVLYSLTAGSGISVTGGQRPVISSTGVSSIGGKSGAVSLIAGDNITISGTTISATGFSGLTSLDAGDGISVDGNKVTNTDTGSSQSIFKTISVNGQNDVVAGSNTDVLSFIAGTGVTLTTDSTAKSVTINSNTTAPTGFNGQFYIGVTGGPAIFATMSGDATINNTGALTISADAVALGTDTTGNYVAQITPGNGISDLSTGSSEGMNHTLSIQLTPSGAAATATTSSGSGLEVGSSGLSLIRGCNDGYVLKWDAGTGTWACGQDIGGLSTAVVGVQEGGVNVGSNITTLNFSSTANTDFDVTPGATNTDDVNIDYTNFGTRLSPFHVADATGSHTIDIGGVTNDGTTTVNIATNGTTNADTISIGNTNASTLLTLSSGTWRITSGGVVTGTSIAAGTNTILGLTNGNLSGTAGITNANLANSSITVTAGSGLSGGGSVSLGSSVSLANAGVISITGTTNQVIASASTGAVTLSLPQSINTAATPTFASQTLAATTNQLILGVTNTVTLSSTAPSTSRTYTIPDFGSNDSFVGMAATQTLTNKTFTDSSTLLQDNLDTTKKLAFQLSGITTATTRTITIPDASGTICLDTGNCAGTGSGVTAAPAGSAGTIAYFTNGSNNIGDSLLSQASSTVTTNGNEVVTGTVKFNTFSTNGGILYTNATGNLAQTGAGSTTTVLHGGTSPSYSAVALTTDVSGTLPIANGGTNGTATPTAGAIAFGTGSAYNFNSAGTANQILTSGGAGTPTFQNIVALLTAGTDLSISGTTNATINDTSTLATVTGRGNSTATGVSLTQNGNLSSSYAVYVKRSTDSSPLGYLIQGQNAAANSTLFGVDVNGLINTASVNSTSIVDGSVANADLSNSSLTVTAGSGLSGGGSVSLGGTITLTNAGVLSITGTTNQVIASASTGAVTLSLPQNINTAATPTFASQTLTATTNQLTLGVTNTTTINSAAPSTSRTYTIPDFGSNDSFVGLAATQTLTNKTFTDSSTLLQDNLDTTKKLAFQLSGITTATTRTLTIPDASGTICLDTGNCAGTGGGIVGTGSTGQLAKFTGPGAIGDSILSESGTTITAAGNIVATGSLNTGTSTSTNGSVVFKNGTNSNTTTVQSGAPGSSIALTLPTTVGTNKQCLKSDGFGVLSFDDCLGGSGGTGVSSLNTLTGGVTIAGAGINSVSLLGSTITVTGTEADTLSTVTGRGNTTSTGLNLTQNGNLTTSYGVYIKRSTDSTPLGYLIQAQNAAANANLFAVDVNGLVTTASVNSASIVDGSVANADLANSSITVTAGSGLSGGGSVSLGSSVSLANAGVLSITGTSNQVIASASTGAVTLSLPQSINTGATPTFAGETLTSTTNQFILGTTNTTTITSTAPASSRTYTIPDFGSNDSFVGLAATQTLTNKTFTDSSTLLQDNLDTTKKLAFQLSGITTATTRTLTIPDASGTICLDTGNCAGSGTSVTASPTGTAGKLAYFTNSSNNIGDSLVSQASSTVTTTGNSVTTGTFTSGTSSAFQIDATGNITTTGTTGFTASGAGAGATFSGSGTHTISASSGTLVLGAHTVNGTITGSGSPTITSFGTINGATLSGGSLSGGTFSAGSVSGGSLTGGTYTATGLTVAGNYTAVFGNSSNTFKLNNGTSDVFTVSNTGVITATSTIGGLTGISSSGTIAFGGLSTNGLVKTTGGTGTLAVATPGTDYENPLTFTNGLTRTTNSVALGGTLSGDTTIANGGFGFNVTGTGNVGIGTTAPGTFAKVGVSGSNAARVSIEVQNTSASGNASFYFQNDRGSFATYGGLLTGGSADVGGTLFGLARADRTFLIADGTSSQGLALGTLTAQPLVLGTNGAEAMRILSNGSVGIGTTAAGQKLTVNGTFGILEGGSSPTYHTIFQGGDQAGDLTYTLPTANAAGVLANNGSGVLSWSTAVGTISGSGTTNYIPKFTGSTTIGNSLLYDDGTSVGIGTASPSQLLELSKASTYQLRLGDGAHDSTWTYDLGRDNGDGYFRFYGNQTGTTGYLFTGIDGERMRISTNGNVGIGNTAGSSLFSVGTASAFQVNSSGAIAAVTGITTSGAYTQSGSGVNSFSGSVGVGVASPSQLLELSKVSTYQLRLGDGVHNSAYTYDLGRDNGDGYFRFYGNQTGANGYIFTGIDGERMRIATNGNVGIGSGITTSLFNVGTAAQFEVNSSGAIVAATGITSSGTINFSGLTASSAVYTDGSKNLTSTAPTSGAVGYFSRTGTTLSPTTAADNITTSGNISTTSSGTITSAGLLTASNGLTLSTGALNLTSTSGAVALTLGSSATAFNVNSGTLDVDTTNSRVGIGTTAPKGKLNVAANPTATADYGVISLGGGSFAGGGGTAFAGNSSGTLIAGNTNSFGGNFIDMQLSGSSIFRVATSGTVYADDTITTAGDFNTAGSYKFGSISGLSAASTDIQVAPDSTWQTLGLYTNGNRALSILSSGNVGIGTTTPEFKLSLASDGGIIANGTFGSGAAVTTAGAGTRLIWYPKKAAFRAGNVSGTSWDDANIGDYSMALGVDAKASGSYANSIGTYITNPQVLATVIGSGVNSANPINALNSNSLSVGFNSTVPTFTVTGSNGVGTTGNVGIGLGSTVPSYKLDVLNPLTTQTASDRVLNVSNATATFNTTSGVLSAYSGYFSSTATRSSGSNALTNIGLYATASGAQNNYAAIFDQGTVGIGTTAPSSLLSVGSTSQFQVNSSGAIAAATGITSSGTINFSGLTASSAVYTDVSKNLTSTAPTSGAIGYFSRSSTTLSPTTAGDDITTSGNIYTSSSGAITSAGLLTASNGLTLSTGALNLTSTSGAVALTLGTSATAFNVNSGLFDIDTTNSRIGIGNTAPGTTLDFSTSVGTNRIAHLDGVYGNTVNNRITIASYATPSAVNSSNILFYTANGITNGERARIDPSGNLGIGTTSPLGLLDISQSTNGVGTVTTNGTTTVTGTGTNFLNTFKIGDTITISAVAYTINGIASNTSLTTSATVPTATAVTYTLTGGDRFMVQGNGYVGIGNTTPSNTLDVTGTGRFTSTLTANTFASSGVTITGGSINSTAIGATTASTGAFTTLTSTPASNVAAFTVTGTNVTSANLINLSSKNTSGTLVNVAYNTATLSGAVTGQLIDLSSTVTNAAQSVTGLSLKLPTTTAASTTTLKGLTLTGGAVTNSAGTSTWTGLDINMPAITQSSGTLTSIGLKITGGTVTSGTSYALTTDFNAGNVGFGTTTPTARLQVVGGANIDNIAFSGISTSVLGAFSGFSDTGYTGFSGGIGTGGSDSFLSTQRLTSTGNLVNIGSIQGGETSLTSAGTFAAKADYTTAAGPASIALGDVNGDGKVDMVTGNRDINSISVFINNGSGTFATKVDYTTTSGTAGIAIADLNGDGKADIVTTNYGSGSGTTVSVFINNGTGTFAAKVDYTTGTSPYDVALGDVNGDGKADIVTANYSPSSVSVLINNGNGTFATKVDYTGGTNSRYVALGDVNGDGKADIAVANNSTTTASILMNNGDGTFATKVDYTTNSTPNHIALGDVNGDGKADMVVVAGTNASVLLNNGAGTFATKVDYTTTAGAGGVSLGDLNGDGKADIAVSGSGAVSVLINNGAGTFATKVDYTSGLNPGAVAIADLNGDGKADIATANYTSSTASVFLNQPSTMFFAQASTGRVGIGLTNASYKTSILDTQSANVTAAITNLTTTDSTSVGVLKLKLGTATSGTSSRFMQFYAGATTDANGTGVGNIALNNGNVAYNTGAADFAEYMNITGNADAGDIIAATSNGNLKAGSTDIPLGVISDSAGFVGNAPQDAADPHQKIVGYVGQIKTKVTTANGPIHIGDAITVSTNAGVGVKATDAGYIVGKALENYTNSDPNAVARILVYVNAGYYDPSFALDGSGNFGPNTLKSVANNTSQNTETLAGVSSHVALLDTQIATMSARIDDILTQTQHNDARLDNHDSQIASMSASLTQALADIALLQNQQSIASGEGVLGANTASDSATFTHLLVTDDTSLNNLSVLGSFNTGILTINGIDTSNGTTAASINTATGPLRLQSDAYAPIEFENAKITMDTTGNIKAENITVKKVKIDTSDQSAATLGKGTIAAGTTSIIINTTAVTENSQIFLTPKVKLSVPLAVTTQVNGTSFKVELTTAQGVDIPFSWFIVDAQPDAPSPSLSPTPTP